MLQNGSYLLMVLSPDLMFIEGFKRIMYYQESLSQMLQNGSYLLIYGSKSGLDVHNFRGSFTINFEVIIF